MDPRGGQGFGELPGGARAIQNSLEVAKLMLQAKLKDAGRRTIFSGATPLRS